MNKQKYLHTSNHPNRDKKWHKKWQAKSRVVDLFSDLPFHESIGGKRGKNNWRLKNFGPLFKFLEQRVDKPWADVYTEIISKTKPKYRQLMEQELNWYLKTFFYDEHYVPWLCLYGGNIKKLVFFYFIDPDYILRRFETEDGLMSFAKKLERRAKMNKIFY